MSRRACSLSLLFSVALVFALARTSTALDEVKVHTSGSTSANVLIYKIGQERGLYREEGLSVLTIAATSQAGIQGLLGGSFDFSQILGQSSARFSMERRSKTSWCSIPGRSFGSTGASR